MGDLQERKLALRQVAMEVVRELDKAEVFVENHDTNKLLHHFSARSERGEGFRAFVSALLSSSGSERLEQALSEAMSGLLAKSDITDSDGALAATHDLLEEYCMRAPGQAFDLALASLRRSADTAAEIVDETRRDLIEIEIRRKQIERTQARTREILQELIGEPL
jgi:hypothetical protein